MDLSKILAISGRPGLYKVISQAKQAVIVESLTDQKRFPVFGHEKISALEEISVFTTGEDRPLKDVLKLVHDKQGGAPAPDPRSDNPVLLQAFREMVPDYDPERVYISDIRKILTWYNLLLQHNILTFDEPAATEKDEQEEVKEVAEEIDEEKKAAEENNA